MKISIITPTYNSEKFINDFLNSVGKQTYKNFEHIIIDGASSDKTLELLKAKKKQITHLLSENDRGVFDAMNKGIKIAKGEIIGFLNSDDFYFNNEILSNVAHLFIKDNTLEAVYANLIYTKKDNIFKNVRFWKSNNFYSGLFSKGWSPPHPTFFVKKSVYEKYGMFNLDYGNASDIEIMMRFLEVYKIKSRYVSDTWVK
jgi:glycosyltransferase involved in cell wall biosynthesis